jgi:hypothetical protein
MYVECCVCHTQLPSVEVAIDDPANGETSSGYCPKHEAEAMAAADAMQVPIVREPAKVEPPADADRDWAYTRSFLQGLNLWPVPPFIVLLIPTALLAAQLGGGR